LLVLCELQEFRAVALFFNRGPIILNDKVTIKKIRRSEISQ